MHSYAANSGERKIIPFLLAILSIVAAWLLNRAFEAGDLSLPWWIDAPSVVGFYGLLHRLFDKHVWRWQFVHTMRLVRTPDLNGKWNGWLRSSFDDHGETTRAELEIRQTWSQIAINMRTDESKSHSVSASVTPVNGNEASLSYEYINEPRGDAVSTMQIHRGTNRLTLSADAQTLEGEYYSGRGRRNFGILSFSRTQGLTD